MTLDMGLRESLTFYDASYIKLALESNLELVTDDEKLSLVDILKHLKVVSFNVK
jgi:predicted nucleic acid-binding protein